MTDAARKKSPQSRGGGSTASTAAPSAAVFVVSFLAAFAAAGSAFGLGGFLGLGIGVVIGLAGAAVCAALAVQGTAGSTAKATALLDIALSDEAPSEPPAGFRAEPWASLYREVTSSAESKRTASVALMEIERLRSGADGSPALPEPPAAHPARRAEDLGRRVEDVAARDVEREIADALRPYGEGLESIEADLASVLATLGSGSAPPPANGSNGTPAAMVDALVRTAADGIEDLAAGLMRANELAGVAERVTNRATLLALNAALEATRSGSEAFASIAEETRRLAEYAREATDTISRLSSEIEFKVGETIASIQSSSEDAKAAVASMGNDVAPGGATASPSAIDAIESLLARARTLRERMNPRPVSVEEVPPAPADPFDPDPRVVEGAEEDVPEAADEPGEGFQAAGDTGGMEASERYATSETRDTGDSRDPAEGDHAAFEPAPRHAAADGGIVGAPAEFEDEPAPMVVTLDASVEEPIVEDAPGAAAAPASAPDREPEPEREREARSTPIVEPKIPDWLEGIRPGENP